MLGVQTSPTQVNHTAETQVTQIFLWTHSDASLTWFQVLNERENSRNCKVGVGGCLGYGGLGLSIEGPSKVDINCEDVEDGTCKVTYCPTEPGNYITNIKFADQHVPGTRPHARDLS